MARLLIVDDQPHVVRILRRSLERDQHEVFTASNGKQACELVAEHRPEVVFSDIEMPLMSGTELCEQLWADYGAQMPHVVLISGHFERHLDEWLAAFDGRVQFHEKPVSVARMREILIELQERPS